jgi:hypothetical protein
MSAACILGILAADIEGRQPVQGESVDGGPVICFPVEEGSNVIGLLEIELSESMSPREIRLVQAFCASCATRFCQTQRPQRSSLLRTVGRVGRADTER